MCLLVMFTGNTQKLGFQFLMVMISGFISRIYILIKTINTAFLAFVNICQVWLYLACIILPFLITLHALMDFESP